MKSSIDKTIDSNNSNNNSINSNSATMSSSAKTRYNNLLSPLAAYSLLAGVYAAMMPGKWIWFSYHPFVMMLAFVLLAANATLVKKIGGYENTKIHGYSMSAACALAAFGWYVIHTNKDMAGKAHLLTIHGKLGVAVLISYLVLGAFGAIALHPDWGIMKTNKTIRTTHKYAGRVMTAISWFVCVLGNINHMV